MDEKQKILKAIIPLAVLRATTREATASLPQTVLEAGLIPIRKFPFRVGRESRVQRVNGKLERIERPKLDDREPNNDLYLVDHGHLLNVSREHFKIEKEDGHYLLVDRGSACGTRIEAERVGGEDSGGIRVLKDGDLIEVGAKGTPYVFEFIVLEGVTLPE